MVIDMQALINELNEKGIFFYLADGKLKTKAKTDAITPDVARKIKQHKQELISFLADDVALDDAYTIKASDRTGALPLSFAQQRLWLLDQIDGGSAHYNMPGVLKLTGTLNVDALNRAFTSIVKRHESLRTCIAVGENGQPVQIVQPATPFVVPVTDLSGLEESERQLRLMRHVSEEPTKLFDLCGDLMLRARLLRISADENILLLTMHHIAADGWSMSILVNEFRALYTAYVNGEENPLTPLSIQYADYAAWQRDWLQGEVLEQHLGYWEKQLADLPVAHGLPLDHPRPAFQTHNGKTWSSTIDRETSRTLHNLCESHGATLFMGLQTAFAVLLSRYSNESDIVMGTPTANREQADVVGLIGFFVNTLVLRSDLSANPTFIELLQQNKKMLLDAYAHQQVPFEQIVERLQPERSQSHSPLFQVMLALENNEEGVLELPGLTLSRVEQNAGVAKYDLTLNVRETAQGLLLEWDYNTDLFERDTIARMAGHFDLLLKGLLAKPEQSIFKAGMLDACERDQLLVDWNSTGLDYPRDTCVHELFEAQAENNPGAVAIVFDEQQFTYGGLNRKANQLAHYLVNNKQVKPDTLVGICLERSPDMVIAILAILKTGGAYVPLDPEYPQARLAYMLEDADLATVLTQTHLCEKLHFRQEQAICLDNDNFLEDLKAYPPDNPKRLNLTPNHLAYVIYTSGSTGNPKGVMIEHASLVSTLAGLSDTFKVTSSDAFGFLASIAFDIALFELFLTLIKGGRSIIVRREALFDFDVLARQLRDCTLLHAVPSLMAEVCAYKNSQPSSFGKVRKIFVGGDYVPPGLLSKLADAFTGADIVELYGPTESTILSSHAVINEELLNYPNAVIGKGLPNRSLYVLTSDGALTPVGVAGELCIGGSGLARGYLNRPELTEEKFIVNPFHDKSNLSSSERLYKTGDLVRWLPNGNLEFLGRTDNQVKIRGFRIEPGEIESRLSAHDDVVDAIVLARDLAGNNKHLVAYVLTEAIDLQDGDQTTQGELIESLRHHVSLTLPDYMVPSAFVLLAQWPLTPNGKVDRKALPEPDVSGQQEIYVAPRTETEKLLCEIWREVLGVERVGVTDNFFQLGGHSLLVIQVISKLQQQGLSLTARQFFAAPRVADLAKELSGAVENNVSNLSPAFKAPDNLIPEGCEHITPEMLPLVSLTPEEIARIVARTPGGAGNVQDIYSLAPLQEGILFHHMMSTRSDPYVLPALFRINGKQAVENFIAALQFIINRHDVLRTAVFWQALSTPVQVVCRQASLPVTWLDMDSIEDIEAEMISRCAPERQWMNLGQAPLLQLQIATDSRSEQHFVLLRFHHMISDHVGLEMIQDELALYGAGKTENLPPTIPYREFVAHTQHQAREHDAEAFFTAMLGDVEESTTPFNLLDVNCDGSRIVELKTPVPVEMSETIRRLARELSMSPAALFHAAWAMVVGACSGRGDVVFGTVLSGRLQGTAGAERMLGVFMNTLPLRVKLSDVPVIELIREVQNRLVELLPYEQTPLALAQSCSGLVGNAPLFSAMFNYRHSAPDETYVAGNPADSNSEAEQEDFNFQLLTVSNRTTYPFNLSVDDLGRDFALELQVDQAVCAERILAYMQTAVAELVNALEFTPKRAVNALSILPEAERRQLLVERNRTAEEYPKDKCIHELFEAQVEATPNAVAVVYENRELTYRQLNGKANRLAHYLIDERQVKPDTLVGLCVERSLEMMVGLLAILKAGGAYVPLDPEYPQARLAYMLKDAKLATVLMQSQLRELVPVTDRQAVCLNSKVFEQELEAYPSTNTDTKKTRLASHHLAYVIYTSGSTGNPKGVLVERKGFRNLVNWYAREYAFDANDRVLIASSVGFDLTQKNFFAPLVSGGRVVFARAGSYDPVAVTNTVQANAITLFNCAPSMLYGVVECAALENYQSLRSLRHVLLGGEPINAALLNPWLSHRACQASLVNMYGPTECTDIVTASLQKDAIKGNCIGKVIANVSVYVLTENHQLSHMGAVGELCVSGAGLARGYLNLPELTDEKFISNPFFDPAVPSSSERLYKTGDLVRWLPDGNLEILGRIDHQVKIRGFRIELGEIENALNTRAEIKSALVLAKCDSNGDRRLVAYIVTDAVGSGDETDAAIEARQELIENIRNDLCQTLPDYMVPSAFVSLANLPLSPNGKVDRKALPEPDFAAQQAYYVAPRTETEKILCGICQDILGIERVGISDNFFRLGGHSLLATRLISRLHQAFNVNLPLRSLFGSRTLEDVARTLSQSDNDPARPALVPVPREQALPASFAQQRLWMLDQIEGGSAHYNITGALKLSGKLDIEALNRAFSSIVERHESLRTCFAAGKNGLVMQVIQQAEPVVVPTMDLSRVKKGARQRQLAELVTGEFKRGFNLSRDLMLRTLLIKLNEKEHIVLVVMHHIAADGWSMGILINEFSALYGAYSRGRENPLQPLDIQYADYANWQRNWLRDEVLDRQLDYWTKQLAGLPVVHSLPLDHPRPAVQGFDGRTQQSRINAEILFGLNKLCQSHGATLFMGLQAAFSVLLARYSNETDIVIGSPIANREQEDVANLIGFFANTLVLRSDLSGDPSFIDLLQQSKSMLLDAYAHQQVPFEQLVERLQPERNLSHGALFQVMLVLQNNEAGILELPGLELSPVEQSTGIAKYDLTLDITETPQGLQLAWEYNTGLFEQPTIARMAMHFEHLLKALIDAPGQSIFKADLLSAKESRQMLVERNETAVDYPSEKCIHELFEEQVEKTPGAVAVIFADQQLTYAELNQKANQLAHYLINEKEVGPDKLVGICIERSLEMVIGILAILKSGGAYVPLDPDYPEARLAYMLKDAQLNTVLTQSHLREYISLGGEQAVCLDSEELIEKLKAESPINPDKAEQGLTSDHLAYVIYTSGSTGNPKGVMVEHKALVNRVDWMNRQYGSEPADRILQKTPFSFDVSVWEFVWPLTVGAGLVLAKPEGHKDPAYLSELIREKRVTKMHFVPSMLSSMLVLGDLSRCKTLRQVFCSGEALALRQVEQFKAACPWAELHNLYGPTEAAIDVSYWDCSQNHAGLNSVPIGRPIHNIQLIVLDRHLNPVPENVAGELHIGGIGLARGYLNRADLTAEKFILNPFHDDANPSSSKRLYKTGDLVRWLPNGNLEFLGRIDHQVKIRGFRIELGEIENTLNASADVREAIVLAKEAAGTSDKQLVAYVVTEVVDTRDENESFVAIRQEVIERLRRHLRQTLPDYMVPSAFVLLARLPLTPNGKVDRKALPEPDVSTQQKVYVAPRTEMEATLCEIWQDVLGIEQVGVTDNFFHLGGHSLSVLQLVSAMNSALNANIKIRDIFFAPTIEALVAEADFSRPAAIHQQLETGLKEIDALRESILEDRHQRKHLPNGYEDFYPLSAIQQSMVFFAQAQPDEPLYHDQFPYVIPLENFNAEVFRKAVGLVVQKHPILRTSFDVTNFEVPLQVVHSECKVAVQSENLSRLPADKQKRAIESYCRQDLRNKFVFQCDQPLWRIKVFVLGAKQICMVLSFQHAILDGWSANILTTELLQQYLALDNNIPLTDQPVEHGYKDYVAINLARSTSGNAAEFWKRYLQDYSRMKLPFNYGSRPISDETGMRILRGYVGRERLQSLMQRTRVDGYSIKEICLAAHVHTLSLLTGDREVLTGVVTHDRPALAGAEKIVGCFLNTIPLRLVTDQTGNKYELLDTVRNYLNQAREHELFLGEIARLAGERNVSGNPLFDTLFNFTDFPAPGAIQTKNKTDAEILNSKLAFSSKRAPAISVNGAEMTNTLLDVEVHKQAEQGLMLQVKYSPKYFHPEEMDTLLSLYISVLESFANADAEIPSPRFVSAINTVCEDPTFNRTDREYEYSATLHELFENQVQCTPDAIALRQHGTTLSYNQLNQRANQIARLLVNKGIKSGDHVGLVIERSFDLIACMFGVLKAGAVYVPMEPGYPQARREAIARSAELKAILVDQSIGNCNDLYICLDNAELGTLSAQNLEIKKDALDLAYIIYTSGSTGLPKGVRIAHHSAVNLVSWVNREFAIGPTDVLLFITSISFDLSVYDVFGVLSAGGSIVIAEQAQVRNPKLLLELIQTERVTFWDSVPTTLNHLVEEIAESEPETSLPGLRLVFLSGDWIPVQLPANVRRYFPNARVISLGGATEGTVWSNYYPVPENVEHRSSIPYGRPIDNNRFYILDTKKSPVINGVVGELYIAGVGVADGYQNNPERTDQSFFDDCFVGKDINGQPARMYKTGDLGRMLPNGNMELHGRVDHQIKLRGFRIELGEIESALYQHESVKEAVASLITEDSRGKLEAHNQYLVAYVVPVGGAELSTESLIRYLEGRLPEYMVPRVFMQLDQLPLTPNGKVDRKALPEPDASALQNTYVAPRTEMEKALSEIWREVLDVDCVGATDNFFLLGGHSLLATRLVARINQAFDVTLPLESLFTSQTLEALAQAVLQLDTDIARPGLVRVPREQDLPVSYAQQRLWLLDQIDGGSAHYNMSESLKLTGNLNVQALNQAFTTIVERHESLRTCFAVGENEEPIQVVQAPVPFAVPVTDLSELSGEERNTKLAGLVEEESGRAFDLAGDPMLRVRLIKLAEEEHIVLVTMHHIASDGWSMSILVNEFSALYSAYVRDRENPLNGLPIQYADYAYWQRHWLRGEVLDQQLAYWEERLNGIPVAHSLPLDRPRPAIQTFNGRVHLTRLEAQMFSSLNSVCQSQGATLFMGLQAAFAVLLARYSNEADIVMGSPIANREQEEVADLIGFFANTLVLRSDLSGNPSFIDLLQQSRDMLLDAYAHQQVPFEQIVERLQPERNLSHSALFQVMLVLQNNQQGILELPGLTLSPVEQNGIGAAKFDLTLNVYEEAQGLILGWEYNTDLFNHDTVVRMAAHFEQLLEALLAAPEQSVFDAEMLSSRERHQLLVEWNQTGTDYPGNSCIHELFEARVAGNSEAIAVVFEDRQLTYNELNRRANQLAHYLVEEKQITPDTLVGVCVERSLEMVVAVLGILKAGGAYVPIDPDYPASRIAHILQDANLNCVLAQSHLVERAGLNADQALCLDDEHLQATLLAQPAENIDPRYRGLTSRHLAYVIYTSGSTGKPKGVMVEHRGVCNLAAAQKKGFAVDPDSHVLQFASISFDAAVSEIAVTLSTGAKLVLARDEIFKSPEKLTELVSRENVTHVTLPPVLLSSLDSRAWSSVRTLVVAGDACPVGQAKEWAKGRKFINAYGPTESSVCASLGGFDEERNCVHIGKPIDNIHLFVLNKNLALSPSGCVGELYIGGAGLARGYLNRPELTDERFIANPFYDPEDKTSSERLYKTGDLVRWLADGNLEFLGRIDHQVKVRGFRIELGEIENTLNAHGDVTDTIVLAKGAPAGDKRLVAYVLTNAVDPRDESESSVAAQHELIEQLRHYLDQSLPYYMVPSAFVLLEQLPLTPNGKVDRNALPEPEAAMLQNRYVAPRTDLEETLCEIWQDVLGVERVGITDNFFQLGGHSLLATRMVARINQALNISFPLQKLFVLRTVEQLSNELKVNRQLSDVLLNDDEALSEDETEIVI